MLEVEQSFSSNICRSTGYRPILDAFKQFAKDSPNPKSVLDIEDVHKFKKNCKSNMKIVNHIVDDWCFLSREDLENSRITKIKLEDDKIWVIVNDVRDIFTVLEEFGTDSYMLVAGNTAKGVYPINEYPKVLIDISALPEIKIKYIDQNLIVDSGTTLTSFIEICREESDNGDFSLLYKFYKHIQLVANIPVRNIATIAGNLMIKRGHNEFPSIIFLLLATVGAELTIASRDSIERHKLVTFKITPRAQNVHAIVNAGFLYKLGKDDKALKCRIVYGNLSPSFIRAEATETYLIVKNLFLNETWQSSIKMMEKELIVKEMPPEPSAKYRKQLAIALYNKMGVDGSGVIQYVDQNHYENYGYLMSEIYLSHYSFEARSKCYNNSKWNFNAFEVTSDTPKNSWCRAPVGSETSSDEMLLDYIRKRAELRGTKYMCREGGCGACIVSAVTTPNTKPLAVNSCLVSVLSCHDWEITTIEKVGNRLDGYHKLQTTLAEDNGTQCGYCTPGFIMSMYSLLQSQNDTTMKAIEKSLSSNICRCTGYRPILEAFHKFASDAPSYKRILDIEDLSICNKAKKASFKIGYEDDDDWCHLSKEELKEESVTKILLKDNKKWYRVKTLQQIFDIWNEEGDDSYMLVGGNTAKGGFPIDEYPRVLIDINGVNELRVFEVDQNLIIGAGTTVTDYIGICKAMSTEQYFSYLNYFYEHINLVAHNPVRNVGTIGGNLMIKNKNNQFQSDIYLLLAVVGAEVTILDSDGEATIVTMEKFIKTDMKRKILLNVMLPPLSTEHKIKSFKIMSRAQSVHAIVNAAFLYKLDRFNYVLDARIVYGGLASDFERAFCTESYLLGKHLFCNETLQSALKVLEGEMVVNENPPEPSAEYRKKLALGLFYKALLSICDQSVLHPRYRSGGTWIRDTRTVSKAVQEFPTDKSLWPLNKNIPKVEALIQCAGETKYTEDLPSFPHEVYAAFVLSTEGSATIEHIDTTKALGCPGVIAFYSAQDIPGINSFHSGASEIDFVTNEELFCSGTVKYHSQPIGCIVAESQQLAEKAAKLVKVTYSNTKTPVTDVKEAIKDSSRVTLYSTVSSTTKGTDVSKVITGDITLYGQYHFSMETLVCVTRPTEEGLEIYSATQWMDAVHNVVAHVLDVDLNSIDVHVRRLGGAYGIKISRATQIAAACSLVTHKLDRPCRFITPMATVMKAIGKRLSSSNTFEVGVNSSGVIQYVDQKQYEDHGYTVNEGVNGYCLDTFNNAYNNTNWNFETYTVTTDNPKNTWCRSPGTLETISVAEFILERIAYEMSLDPTEVRLANVSDSYSTLKDIVASLKTKSDYLNRKENVETYNTNNRWKKRGLRFSFLRWTPTGTQKLDINLSVYHGDGSVIITHGGIEMGQGLNTKAIQITAYMLGISIDKIKIKENNTTITPNSYFTGGSLTCQNVGAGVKRCCEELLSRLEPIKKEMTNPTWEELIAKAFSSDVDLQVHEFVGATDTQTYNVYGAALAEVEIDVITGETEILRVDLVTDVGHSVSPGIDIGQVEGAFVMGQGYWTCEHLEYDSSNGELLTNRAWTYHVPQGRDIPQDFRVYVLKNSYSEEKFLGAKGSGEPLLCMSVAVPLAIRAAVVSARLEAGYSSTEWFQIDGAHSMEKIYLACGTKKEDFKFY